MENYEEVLDKEFMISQSIDEKFARICNEEGRSKGIKYLKELGATWLDIDSYDILYAIGEFTKSTTSNERKNELIERIRKQEDVIDAKIEMNSHRQVPQMTIKREDGIITVMPFSSFSPQALTLLPDLENDKRDGTCFEKAYKISLNLGKKNDIVTGYTYGYTDKSKYLHSWIETELHGEEIVIDGALNSIFNKDGYYKLRKIEQLTRISNIELEQDIDRYFGKIGEIPFPFYYI